MKIIDKLLTDLMEAQLQAYASYSIRGTAPADLTCSSATPDIRLGGIAEFTFFALLEGNLEYPSGRGS